MIALNTHITCYIYTFPKDTIPNFSLINSILNNYQIDKGIDLHPIPNLNHYQTDIEEVLLITQYKLSQPIMFELYQSFKDFNKENWNYIEFL
jgi:hypothetical protein